MRVGSGWVVTAALPGRVSVRSEACELNFAGKAPTCLSASH